MSEIPSKLLLYPQNLLFPEKAEKIFSYISQIVILKLPKTSEILESIYKERFPHWKEKIEFLEFRDEHGLDWNQIAREVDSIEEWGLNFRTPENLKYFSQFRETLEESLEGLFPTLNKKEKKEAEEKIRIRKSIVLLSLAEKLDFRLYEIKKSLREVEEKYNQVFEEKIIGEDETFKRIINIKDPLTEYVSEELPNLKLRISAWKIIAKHLNWSSVHPLNGLLITEKELLENWKEDFPFKKIVSKEEKIEVYKFRASISALFGISEKEFPENYFPETGVVIIST